MTRTAKPRTGHRATDAHTMNAGAALTSSDDHDRSDAQSACVVAGPKPRAGHLTSDAHSRRAGADPTPSDDHRARDAQLDAVVAGPLADQASSDAQHGRVSEAYNGALDQLGSDAHSARVRGGPTSSDDHGCTDAPSSGVVAGPTSPAAIARSTPNAGTPQGTSSSDNGHPPCDTHGPAAVVASNTALDQSAIDAHSADVEDGPISPATRDVPTPIPQASPGIHSSALDHVKPDAHQPGVEGGPPGATSRSLPTSDTPLVDKPLAVLAELLTDLEDLRKANVNRLEVMTRVGTDKDGENRGWELPEEHPAVLAVRNSVVALKQVEDKQAAELEKLFKSTPLGPWVVAQHGLGLKTVARLLAATGDPYWNYLHNRPRTVSELWAYCGYKPGLKRVKGEKVNWSPAAKMRMHNVIEPIKKMLRTPCYSIKDDKGAYVRAVHIEGECTCSPYRVLWDLARDKYAGSTHPEDCPRCGPTGHPALAGSPRSAAHQAAMADRVVKKAVLRDLWREAKRLHDLSGGHGAADAHEDGAVGA